MGNLQWADSGAVGSSSDDNTAMRANVDGIGRRMQGLEGALVDFRIYGLENLARRREASFGVFREDRRLACRPESISLLSTDILQGRLPNKQNSTSEDVQRIAAIESRPAGIEAEQANILKEVRGISTILLN